MSAWVLLVELHSERCRCGGGSYMVSAGQAANPQCLDAEGRPPVGTTYMSVDEWTALGKPITTEAHQAALSRLADRREAPRVKVSLNLALQRGETKLGVAVTENIGEGGALVLTPVMLQKGEDLVVEEMQGGLKSRAKVLDTSSVAAAPGRAPVFRIRLRFLDADAPRQVRRLLYERSRTGG